MEISVRDAGPRGRGVFALRSFSPGQIIEICPVIVLLPGELKLVDATSLFAYYFGWLDSGALATGFGCFYNHSDGPNARYEKDYQQRTITFLAMTSIKPDEEITIHYNTGTVETPLWFEPR